MRRLLALPLIAAAAPLDARPIEFVPIFGTELRYEQYSADRLLGANDAVLLRARPGIAASTGVWSLQAVSDAAIAVRRIEPTAAIGRPPARPEAVQLDELRISYRGLPATEISVGRQHLGIAGAAITGDRDGQQTFDGAHVRWSGLANISADLAYAWSSSTLLAERDAALPASVPGDNLFAQVNWKSQLGTLSGYLFQIDQRDTRASSFRLLNQVYGARFSGTRKIDSDTKLVYSMGYFRQTGSLANGAAAAPTYWQIGSRVDFADLAATQTSYRRFAANGITMMNGDTISLATSATRGRLTLAAAYNSFRPLDEQGVTAAQNMRLSMGLAF